MIWGLTGAVEKNESPTHNWESLIKTVLLIAKHQTIFFKWTLSQILNCTQFLSISHEIETRNRLLDKSAKVEIFLVNSPRFVDASAIPHSPKFIHFKSMDGLARLLISYRTYRTLPYLPYLIISHLLLLLLTFPPSSFIIRPIEWMRWIHLRGKWRATTHKTTEKWYLLE